MSYLTSKKNYDEKYPALSAYLAEICLIPGGSFNMGSNKEKDEKPIHRVELSPFLIGKTPITVAIWREYIEANTLSMPDKPKNLYWQEHGWQEDHPIINVSWGDCIDFCKWVMSATGLSASLPTEAQWEYVARGGRTDFDYPWGDAMDNTKCWYVSTEEIPPFNAPPVRNTGGPFTLVPTSMDIREHKIRKEKEYVQNILQKRGTASVNRKDRIFENKDGVKDICGNIFHWCNDYYLDNWYVRSDAIKKDSENRDYKNKNHRVIRGFSWTSYIVPAFPESSLSMRCAKRGQIQENTKRNDIGFRICVPKSK